MFAGQFAVRLAGGPAVGPLLLLPAAGQSAAENCVVLSAAGPAAEQPAAEPRAAVAEPPDPPVAEHLTSSAAGMDSPAAGRTGCTAVHTARDHHMSAALGGILISSVAVHTARDHHMSAALGGILISSVAVHTKRDHHMSAAHTKRDYPADRE